MSLSTIQNRLWNNVQYKFSIIFSSIYVVIFIGNYNNSNIFIYILLSIILSIGIAGLGYLINDLKDIKDDLVNNKPNLYNNNTKFNFYIIGILLTAFTIIPWFYLPFTKVSFLFILIEFLLFILYSIPPFRLKEKGFLGVLTDALYAHVVPCILAIYTFKLIVNTDLTSNYFLIAIFCFWLIVTGIRNIINHQIDDYTNDINSNTPTYVTKVGITKSKRQVLIYILPIELILFIVVLYYLPINNHLMLIVYLAFLLMHLLFYFLKHKQPKTYLDSFYVIINKKITNEFYEIHLPILLLIYFSIYQPIFRWILYLNLLLFSNIYIQFLKKFIYKYFRK